MKDSLEELKLEQKRLADRIQELERANRKTIFRVPADDVALSPDEHYAGIILGSHPGCADYHLILNRISGGMSRLDDAVSRMGPITGPREPGTSLPTRREMRQLVANLYQLFPPGEWYWTGESTSQQEGWAMFIDHLSVSEGRLKSSHYARACAVRRVLVGACFSGNGD